MIRAPHDLFAVRKPVPPPRGVVLVVLAFVLPLLAWSLVSYVPFVWHPLVAIVDPGSVDYVQPGTLLEREAFEAENAKARAEHRAQASGVPANPVYLPAPHQVVRALYTAFKTPPRLPSEPWLHESLLQSLQVMLWGFLISSLMLIWL